MEIDKLVAALGLLFPNSPYLIALLVFICLVGWKIPEILKISLEHFRENKRINSEIDNQNKKTALELQEKRAKLEGRRRRPL